MRHDKPCSSPTGTQCNVNVAGTMMLIPYWTYVAQNAGHSTLGLVLRPATPTWHMPTRPSYCINSTHLCYFTERYSSSPLVHNVHQAEVEVKLGILVRIYWQTVFALQPSKAMGDGNHLARRANQRVVRQHRIDTLQRPTRYSKNTSCSPCRILCPMALLYSYSSRPCNT